MCLDELHPRRRFYRACILLMCEFRLAYFMALARMIDNLLLYRLESLIADLVALLVLWRALRSKLALISQFDKFCRAIDIVHGGRRRVHVCFSTKAS